MSQLLCLLAGSRPGEESNESPTDRRHLSVADSELACAAGLPFSPSKSRLVLLCAFAFFLIVRVRLRPGEVAAGLSADWWREVAELQFAAEHLRKAALDRTPVCPQLFFSLCITKRLVLDFDCSLVGSRHDIEESEGLRWK